MIRALLWKRHGADGNIARMSRTVLVCLSFALAGCAALPPPRTVESVDLARYAGAWHEIESFPNFFQRGCTGTKAVYTPLTDGTLRVVNECVRGGRKVSVTGTARPVAGSDNAKLKVRIGGPFEGDYWILDLDRDYRWAAVGHPNRRYLWILARELKMDSATLQLIQGRLAAQGYDISRLRPTPPAP